MEVKFSIFFFMDGPIFINYKYAYNWIFMGLVVIALLKLLYTYTLLYLSFFIADFLAS